MIVDQDRLVQTLGRLLTATVVSDFFVVLFVATLVRQLLVHHRTSSEVPAEMKQKLPLAITFASVALSLLLFVIACVLPAHGNETKVIQGWALLIPDFQSGVWFLCWWWIANPLLLVGILFCLVRNAQVSIRILQCATSIASTSVLTWWFVFCSETGPKLMVGSFVWVASMLVLYAVVVASQIRPNYAMHRSRGSVVS